MFSRHILLTAGERQDSGTRRVARPGASEAFSGPGWPCGFTPSVDRMRVTSEVARVNASHGGNGDCNPTAQSSGRTCAPVPRRWVVRFYREMRLCSHRNVATPNGCEPRRPNIPARTLT